MEGNFVEVGVKRNENCNTCKQYGAQTICLTDPDTVHILTNIGPFYITNLGLPMWVPDGSCCKPHVSPTWVAHLGDTCRNRFEVHIGPI